MACEVLVRSPDFLLTEGPHWDARNGYLYFVDVFGYSVCKLKYSTEELERAKFQSYSTSVIPRENHPSLIVTIGLNICAYDFETKSLDVLCTVEPGDETRLNDSKCDISGRLWTGTMGLETSPGVVTPHAGSMYSYDGQGVLNKREDKISISNGFAWSLDNKTLYFIDSCARNVVAYDFDVTEAKLSNKRVCIDFTETELKDALPDGMCVDAEGMLWVAMYQGWKVVRVNPKTGKIIHSLTMPVAQVTSCCFAGENLDHLIVTTARMGLTDEDLKAQPLAGSVFRFKDVGVKGLPGVSFKG